MRKTAVVTGATSGLGRALAHNLARRGFDLIVPCRSLRKAEALRSSVALHSPGAALDFIHCDLSDLDAVARCGDRIALKHPVIDLIVANAATVSTGRALSAQGLELTFAVNHLAHFLLVNRLLDNLFTHSRVITVASSGARWASPGFLDDLHYRRRRYGLFRAYANSKLANIGFSTGLAEHLQGRQIACICVHPGMLDTAIWPAGTGLQKLVIEPLRKFYFDSPERGAEVIEHFAVDPRHNETTGYFELTRRASPPVKITPSFVQRLWDVSLDLCGEYLPRAVCSRPRAALEMH